MIIFNLTISFLVTVFSFSAVSQLRQISNGKPKPNIIVFIHGLNSNSSDCWSNKNFFFPNEFATDESLKEFTVYTYDYPSTCKVVTPSEAAINLKEAFETEAILPQSVHIIAHSLGGIVSREFLVKFPKMKVATIQLLATPNLGSSYESIAEFICGAVGISRIVTLGASRGEGVDLLNDNWRIKFEQNDGQKNFKFYSAFESPLGIGKVVVEKDSALLFSSSTKYFTVGHMGISKPESRQDDIYKWVRRNILKPSQIEHVAMKPSNQNARFDIITKQLSVMEKKSGIWFANKFVQYFNLRYFSNARELLYRQNKLPKANQQIIDAILYDYQNNLSEAVDMYMMARKSNFRVYNKNLIKELIERNCFEIGLNCKDINDMKKLEFKDLQLEFLKQELFQRPAKPNESVFS